MSLACIENYENAVREARYAVALDPLAFTARWALVWSLAALGKDDEAITAATEALLMSGRHPRILADVAAIHARRGATRAALEILDELRGRAATGFVERAVLGTVAASSGLMAEARTLVARAIAEHETFWHFAKSPAWAPFRADPEGAAMLHTIGF
jgi:Flp pilus assembly protein TadD